MTKYKNILLVTLVTLVSTFLLSIGGQKISAQELINYEQCGGENPASAIVSLKTGA